MSRFLVNSAGALVYVSHKNLAHFIFFSVPISVYMLNSKLNLLNPHYYANPDVTLLGSFPYHNMGTKLQYLVRV